MNENSIGIDLKIISNLFNRLGKGFICLNENFQVLQINQTLFKIINQSSDVVKEKNIFAILNEHFDIKHLETVLSDIRDGNRLDSSVLFSRKMCRGGAWRLVCIAERPFEDRKSHLIFLILEKEQDTEQLVSLRKIFQAIMNASPDIVFVKDVGGVYLEVNKAFAKAVGISVDELKGKMDRDLFPADEVEKLKVIDQRIKETGEYYEGEYVLHINDQEILFHTTKIPIYSDQGHFIGICGYANDITDKKRFQKCRRMEYRILELLNKSGDMRPILRQVLEILREMTGINNIAIRIRETDDYPYFDYIGFPELFIQQEKHLCQKDMNGIPIQDENGKIVLECVCGQVIRGEYRQRSMNITEFGSFWTTRASDVSFEAVEKLGVRRLRGVCFEYGYQTIILIPLTSQGERLGLLQFCDERSMNFNVEFIHYLENIASSVAMAVNRMLYEKVLIQTKTLNEVVARAGLRFLETGDIKNLLSMVIEQAVYLTGSAIGMIIDKPDDQPPHILAVSGFRRTSTGEKQPFFKLGEEMDWKNVVLKPGRSLLSVSLEEGQVLVSNHPMDHPLWRGDLPEGHPPIQTIMTVPIFIEDRVSGMIAVGNNPEGYTSQEKELLKTLASPAGLAINYLRQEKVRKIMEEQLYQAQKMEAIGRLAGGVAHDFNNMLSIIKGYAEMILMDMHSENPIRADVQEILKAAKHSETLTRQLLAFSRSQSITPQIIDINKIISDSEKMLNRLIGEEIEFLFIPGIDLWLVHVDPSQINQILVNLTVNAYDAIDGQGRITVKTANVSLDKHFCNLHPEASPGDFVRLSVSDTGCGMSEYIQEHIFEPFFTTKGKNSGTGLGLATVYGIVKQNKGFVLVSSQEGKGTTFDIYIPRCREEDGVSITTREIDITKKGSGTILLVEDEEPVRRLVKSMLERIGYKVIEAGSPGDACILCEQYKGDIHLLLTDVIMPVMNGKDLSERIKSLKPDIKTIYMSGYPADVIAHHGMLEEDIHFIQKPFKLHDLARMIQRLLPDL